MRMLARCSLHCTWYDSNAFDKIALPNKDCRSPRADTFGRGGSGDDGNFAGLWSQPPNASKVVSNAEASNANASSRGIAVLTASPGRTNFWVHDDRARWCDT